MYRQLLFKSGLKKLKSGHKKLKSVYKKLKSAYKNHAFCHKREPVPDSYNKRERVPDSYNKRERVPDSYKWRESIAHALEQIARALAARRPSKEARCFLGRSKAKWLYLKTAIIML